MQSAWREYTKNRAWKPDLTSANRPKSENPMTSATDWERPFLDKTAVIGIVGMGYVGMPLALAAWSAGYRVVGFDVDPEKVAAIKAGKSYIKHIAGKDVADAVANGRLDATADFSEVAKVHAVIICVPTPLTSHREPDLSYVEKTTEAIAPHLRKGHLIVLESTTWPGTTDEIMKPILERGGMKSGKDFFWPSRPSVKTPAIRSTPPNRFRKSSAATIRPR